MIGYIDSSALIKRYLIEAGSETLAQFLQSAPLLMTSSLTELEIWAAFERAKRVRRIDSPNYRRLATDFSREMAAGFIALVPINPSIHSMAIRAIRQRRLRAPDAVQLATALSFQGTSGTQVEFICADRALLEAARLEGIRCHDVSSE